MAEFVKVKDFDHLVRDKHSTGVVSTDATAYERARERTRNAQCERDELRNATREINTLKNEIHEIKSLLTNILEK